MSNLPQTIQPPQQPGPSDSEVRLLSEILGLQKQQLANQQQEIQNAHEYAKLALEVQSRDLAQERQHTQGVQRQQLLFGGGVIFAVLFFIGWAAYFNKDQLAMELVKTLALLCAGGLGGYGLRSLKEKKDSDSE